MTGWGLGMTKGDDPFSERAQHDVPREITHFPKGHVKPCPYGTIEASPVTLPVNGHHAVPLREPHIKTPNLFDQLDRSTSSCYLSSIAIRHFFFEKGMIP
ncbi:MAG: hypothetical protein DIKNOCCD_03082 [bacterium]|nr:hypothetical protein [bacterium]